MLKTNTLSRHALCVALLGLATTTSGNSIRTVALTGDDAPYGPSEYKLAVFSQPVLNDSGETAFNSFMTYGLYGGVVGYGMWSEGGGSLELVARVEDPFSSVPDETTFYAGEQALGTFRELLLSDSGQLAFISSKRVIGSATIERGIWSQRDNGELEPFVREGEQAPGVSNGSSFSFLRSFVLNDSTQIAFRSSLIGSDINGGNDFGIWSGRRDSLALVARTGNRAPGVDRNFSGLRDPTLNNAGQVAFSGSLSGVGFDGFVDGGIWLGNSDSLALIARDGEPAPGTDSNVYFSYLGSPALNDSGQTAFQGGFISENGANKTNGAGIWLNSSGSTELVALEGDPAPDTPGGVRFSGFGDPHLNAAGQTAFSGFLTGEGVEVSNGSGIWSESKGSLGLVARRGQQAPGAPVGVSFDRLFEPEFNDLGQTAFFGRLSGTGVDTTNDYGIWAEDLDGSLRLIVREGDLLEVAPGDFREVLNIDYPRTPRDRPHLNNRFNNAGQIAFNAIFTNGSDGVFVSNLVAVPEPSGCVLGVLAFGCFATRRGVA